MMAYVTKETLKILDDNIRIMLEEIERKRKESEVIPRDWSEIFKKEKSDDE